VQAGDGAKWTTCTLGQVREGEGFDILLFPKEEDSYGRGGVFHPLASVGSWAERLTARLLSRQALLSGYPPIGPSTEGISGWTQSKGQPYILGLNAEALRPKSLKEAEEKVKDHTRENR
jgi:hypothetical protein